MTAHDHQTTACQPTAPDTGPRGRERVSAREVIQFALPQKRLADLDVEIDFEALAGLDDEAAKLIDETMRRLMSG
ncbi:MULTISPECIES: hypothetical protein [Streptomyces]